MYGQSSRGTDPPCSETSTQSLSRSSDQVDHFLYSPIETLLESIVEEISVHDVIEAYNLFSNRTQANIQLMTHDLALPILQRHSSAIANALHRDIQSLFNPPSSLAEEDTYDASENVLLCHEALRLLSNIFTFPALFRCFNNSTLSPLLSLVISTSGLGPSKAPPLCQPKTILLVVWLLKMQRLPVEVLVSNREAVTSVLRRCIQGDAGKNQVLVNGLQAAANVIQHHPNQFLEPLSVIISPLLNNLFSEVPEIRTYSTNVLGAFAMARLQSDEMTVTLRRIADQVTNMVESSRQRLAKLLTDAMSITGPTQPGFGPVPALCLTAALMILCDAGLLTHPRVLMTLIVPLEKSLAHKSSSVRLLHPHVWNCLVWSFGRLNAANTIGTSKLLGKAFDFIKQELRQGIGTAIISLFLPSVTQEASDDAIARVLQVLQDMGKHKSLSVKRKQAELLSRLLAGSVDPESVQGNVVDSWPNACFLRRSLFDGTLLRAGAENVSAAIRLLAPPDIASIRSLTDQEVESNWHPLRNLWSDGVRNMLAESDFDYSGLLSAWQTLLLAQAEFTQEHCHFTTDLPLQADIIQTVVDLVIDSTSSTKPDTHLTFVKQLIGVIKNVYAMTYAKRIGESVLCELLRHSFDLTSPEIRQAWSDLCHDLLSLGVDRVLEIIGMMVNEVEMQRSLWIMIVRIWQNADADASWQNIVQALAMPFGVWKLSPSETEGWEAALASAVLNAISKGDQRASVVQSFMQLVGEENIPILLENPSIVLALLSEAVQQVPYPACCSRLLNESLCHFYTQRTQPMDSSLTLLGLVRKAFLGTPTSAISPLLKDTEQGLRLWLIDEHLLLSDDQYNQHIIPIYCLALESLQRLPPTAGTITDFGDFLTSAFVRVPSPALGPKAFRAYWQATFHGRHEFVAVYPDSLKQCLKAFDEAAGGDLGMGLSLETASDVTPTPRSVVSSSQSPFGRGVEMLYDVHRFSQPRFTNTAVTPNKLEPKMLLSPGSDQIFMEPPNRSLTSHSYRTPQAVPDLRQFEDTERSGRQGSLLSVTAGNPLKASASGTWLRTKRNRGKRRKADEGFFSSPETPRGSPQFTSSRAQDPPYEEEEDYDSWEIGISGPSELEHASSPEPTSATGTEPVAGEVGEELLDSSLRSRRRDRSQTEPQEMPSPDPPRRIPLKRNQTTSARLEALQRAHVLVHDDASQVPVEDLEHAAMLVQQIGNALNEQMNRRVKKR
ncbi:hypothetical protein PC9H_006204 [Pleurotus ostreatus]|uniref:Telomere-associated protein Rif1 N-terminal domain-containing protein n=1 Tax=Pleurotus ostreatus TaxID=5322 RepID=A0A8H7A0H6_PLEOS|nr:uncharacterized protein PC9H_006204 [Pleurotus ostreatus]KAF7430496.1 hypothetical protein PC9H_006204 [Pleurotus ostreatus]